MVSQRWRAIQANAHVKKRLKSETKNIQCLESRIDIDATGDVDFSKKLAKWHKKHQNNGSNRIFSYNSER
jgi:hypothetical protein